MKRLFFILFFIITGFTTAIAQHILEGEVLNSDTKEPIAGASIRIVGTQKGTYSSDGGKFRLPLPDGANVLKISSIGFKEKTVNVSTAEKNLTVLLIPSAITTEGIVVTAGLSAEQIVSRAISRIKTYSENLNTYEGLLYTKLVFEVNRGSGSASGNGNGVSVTLGGGKSDESKTANVITETFSKAYFDKSKGSRFTVIQRRQTANIPPSANAIALGNFFNFYDNEIELPSIELASPLGENALKNYNFSIDSKTMIDDKEVYVIAIEPASRLFPAFKGTMKILADTYDPLEISVRPSENTAIPTVRDLSFIQKFEKLSDDIWQPAFLQVGNALTAEVLKGFFEIALNFNVTSIYNEFQFNKAIPDSIFGDGKRIVTVAPMADSTRPEFWENNSLSALTLEEQEIYKRVDSIEAAKKLDSLEGKSFLSQFSLSPVVEFNRVASISAGAEIDVALDPVRISTRGLYSFGLWRAFGDAGITIDLFKSDGFKTSINGNIFSRIQTGSTDEGIPILVNTVFAALAHKDYYDYFRKDGWNAGLNISWQDFLLDVGFENSRHTSLDNITSRSIFKKEPFRPNPPALDGNYNIFKTELQYGGDPESIFSLSSGDLEFEAHISAQFGTETTRDISFKSFEGLANLTFPTFPLGGYSPMFLKIGAQGGLGSDNLPQQFQFRMRTSTSIIGGFGRFLSAPVGAYGGTEYHAFYAEHNFSDLLWRAVGLPLYEGRGIELNVGGAAGKFFQNNPVAYSGTNNDWYSEVGFGLSRIPTFVSNIIFLRTDFRWGLGTLGAGNFGMSLGASFPF